MEHAWIFHKSVGIGMEFEETLLTQAELITLDTILKIWCQTRPWLIIGSGCAQSFKCVRNRRLLDIFKGRYRGYDIGLSFYFGDAIHLPTQLQWHL